MKAAPFILRIFLMALALAGAVAVLIKIFAPPDPFAPRREYELELRFALASPGCGKKEEEKPPKNDERRALIPEAFRTLIAEKAEKYGFPPELIAGIIARESGFDPRCKAPDGGMGLMQLMPAVCREYRCKDPWDPAANVETGTAHLSALREYFSNVPDPADRIRFALAAYNGGAGHVIDARAIAGKLKLDPDKWHGNVEEAIQFLKFRSFWKKARHGYCNADVVVSYVNGVLALAERFRNN